MYAKRNEGCCCCQSAPVIVAAGESVVVDGKSALVEAGASRSRRKGTKYKFPTDLANACGETASLGGEESMVLLNTSNNNNKRPPC